MPAALWMHDTTLILQVTRLGYGDRTPIPDLVTRPEGRTWSRYVEEARAESAEALRINPDYSLQDLLGVLPYKNTTVRQNIIDGLRKAGLPE